MIMKLSKLKNLSTLMCEASIFYNVFIYKKLTISSIVFGIFRIFLDI